MIDVIIVLQILLTAQKPIYESRATLSSYLRKNDVGNFANRIPGSEIVHLQIDLTISSTIHIRSEELSLIGNNSSLLFHHAINLNSEHPLSSQNHDSSNSPNPTSDQQHNEGAAASIFMFDVSNSTFSVKGVHGNCNSGRNGICSISGSQVQFSSSMISSNGFSSPFMVRMFDCERCQQMSSISLIGVSHLSKTCTLPPLVGLLRPQTITPSAPNSDFDDPSLDAGAGVSIVGADLVVDSTSFTAGTGPLFSFGLAEEPSLTAICHSLRMETTLLGGSLVNVTSRRVETKRELLFGGGVSQRVVGCSIGRSSNHNSGTAMMDVNLGGNLRCANTSFSECRREGNADPSIINENITQTNIGRQFFDIFSTANLVSYSLCTFKDMIAATGESSGGSAICILSSVSLSIKECFFLRCHCVGSNDDGGAIFMHGFSALNQYFLLERSSFSECKTIGAGSNYAGCVFLISTPSVTINDCFFEKGEAQFDGALTLYSGTHSILFNCAFVLCSSVGSAGAVGIQGTATFEFFFVQFRLCSSTYYPNARDVFFLTLTLGQVTSDMFTNCDSSSGSPNVYFGSSGDSDDTFIPQLTSTPIISDIDIQFNEDRMLATVIVTASTAIGGTMGILLDGLIVPRLVHVVFGTETEPSQTGTAVVSSGPNGILPKADYTVLNYSISSSLFPPPTILNCECSLNDANTSLIIVSGWCLEDGNYVMKFKKGQNEEEKQISLTWVNSSTLRGTAPMYPSTAEGRLEWDTEYEVTRVVRRTPSEDIEIELSPMIKLTTPEEPIRIEGADCSLGGSKEKAGVVEFWGVGLSSGKGYTLKVQKKSSSGVLSGVDIELVGTLTQSSGCESGRFSHTEEIFGVSPCRLSYGSSYSVVGIVVGGVEGVVNAKVGFSVADEPCRLTKTTESEFTDAEKTKMELSFETRALSGNTDYSMVVESIVGEGKTVHEKEIVLSTNSNGEIEPISVKLYPREDDATQLKGQLEFGTRYHVKRIEQGSTEIHIETAATTITTPSEPARIEVCVLQLLSEDRTKLTLILTGQLFKSTHMSICLFKGSHEWLHLTSIAVENDTHCSVVFQVGTIEDSDTLAFGKDYTLQQFGNSPSFVVMNDIVISVPNPPSLHTITFSFANDLNTSCVVDVTGSNLVASIEYNMTLNSSLFVIVRFSSSTKGKSDEIPIGWEGGLKFDTDYTVTSITPLNEENGDILLLETVSGETGKRPSSFNIFADSSSLEGSPFCGDLERACSSMSEVWTIVCGLVIVRPTIEIVDSVTMNEEIRIVGGMHVVIRNGTSSEPSLIVPSSFSVDEMSGVIDVEAPGFLEIRNVDVWIESSDPSFVFISATEATIILREGSITGPKSSPTRNVEESDDVCSWTTGVLHLTDCTTNVSHQDLTHLSQGVVNMKGGNVSFVSSLFSDNSPDHVSFPSFRRNLMCSHYGTVDVGSLTGGDGTLDHHHLWMSAEGCTLTGECAKPLSPLFVPSLSASSVGSFDKKKELFEIEVKGSTLIPCGLFLEVFEVTKEKKEGAQSRHPLNRNTTTTFTETSIKLTLPSSSLSSLKPELEWRGRLVFGKEQKTDSTFIVQPNRIERLSQSVKENMKWWLPLVIVVAVALLVVILLIVVCMWRRKKNGRKEDKEPLMSPQEMEVEKFEQVEEDANAPSAHVSSVRGLNGNTLNVGHWTENEPNTTLKRSEEKEERDIPFENRVCGLSCGEKDGVVEVVDKKETLYRRLHVLKIGVDQRWAQLSVARGLSRAMKMSQYSAILTELTSHSVVLSGERAMSLILKSDANQPDPIAEQPTQLNEENDENKHVDEITEPSLNFSVQETEQKPAHPQPAQIVRPHPLRQSEVHRDDVRWQAPEEGEDREEKRKHTEGEVQKAIDRTKVSVFRLGLVLWEIETGLVPFAEQDGVNAHRNLSIGILPPMEGVGEKMKDLISECLSVNPDDRPSVDSIISRLSLMDGLVSAQKAQHVALS